MVHALAAFLDDAPRMSSRTKRVNWISQAFGVLTQSRPRVAALKTFLNRLVEEPEANWIERTFAALATESHVRSSEPWQSPSLWPRPCSVRLLHLGRAPRLQKPSKCLLNDVSEM